MTEACEMQI